MRDNLISVNPRDATTISYEASLTNHVMHKLTTHEAFKLIIIHIACLMYLLVKLSGTSTLILSKVTKVCSVCCYYNALKSNVLSRLCLYLFEMIP